MGAKHIGLLALFVAAAYIGAAQGIITMDPPTLSKNGQLIKVTWDGIPTVNTNDPMKDPMPADTLALIQTDAPFGSKYPLRYIWVSQTANSTYRQGKGSATFWVVNHRQDLQFVYLRYKSLADGKGADFAWGRQTILDSATLKISPALKVAPHQLRLSLRPTNSNNSSTIPKARNVQVAWQSTIPNGVAVASRNQSAVQWYIDQQTLPNPPVLDPDTVRKYRRMLTVVNASADTYTAKDMCGFPANSSGWLDPGYTNFATWPGLDANRKYWYTVGGIKSGFSDINMFRTPPLSYADCFIGDYDGQPCDQVLGECRCIEANVDPLRILLAADLGTNNHQDATWSADGQGFSVLNSIQSVDKGINGYPGPLWPGRMASTTAPDGSVITVPYSTVLYSLYTVADFPTWGQQPATYYMAQKMNKEITEGRYHGAFIVGDIAYAEGMSAHWDMFLTDFEPMLSGTPTMFSNGNHESADKNLPDSAGLVDPESTIPDAGGECGIAYEERLRMPMASGVDRKLRPEYYSYTMGPVAVIVLSTEQKWSKGSAQYNWLVKEFDKFAVLRAAGRIPWLVVAFHRPMYVDDPDISIGLGNQWVASVLRDQLEPLFAKYQVDMTWTGHTHFYHRSCPVFKGGCRSTVNSPDGNNIYAPVHLMVGNGGFQPGASIFNTTPPWIEVESFNFGYCSVEATQTKLNVQCFNAVDGKKFDDATLAKPDGWQPNPTAAVANYAALLPVPTPIGVNITADLGPTQEWLLMNLKNITEYLANNTIVAGDIIEAIDLLFGPGFPTSGIINALPGTKLYGMADVTFVYFSVMSVIAAIFKDLKPAFALPATEELAYVLNLLQPTGRLYKMVNGLVPK